MAELRSHSNSRAQWLLLTVIVAVGAGLRFEGLHELSLSQYDEGVYVHNGIQAAFGKPLDYNFDLPLHAPPGFPWAIGAVCWLLQAPWPTAGTVVSALAGTATIPVVFLIGQRLGSSGAGLAAAALLATSDLHVAFSRMALTDVPMTLWFTLAVYCVLRLDEVLGCPGTRSAGFAAWRASCWTGSTALCIALAWNTKYNGWMPAVVALAACTVCAARSAAKLPQMSGPLPSRRCWQLLVRLALASCLAAACYLPWYLFVERNFPGGYAAVTDHHRTYIGGWSTWHHHLWRHLLTVAAFRHYGWILSGGGVFIVLLACVYWSLGAARGGNKRLVSIAAAVAAAGGLLIMGTDAMLLVCATFTLLPALLLGRFSHVLIAVWALAFVVAVPFYHPYSRLLVPLLPAAAALSAVAITNLWQWSQAATPAGQATPPQVPPGELNDLPQPAMAGTFLAAAVVCAAIGLTAQPFGLLPSHSLWQRWASRSSYRAVAELVRQVTEPEAVVICQAQPTLALYVERERIPIGNVPFTQALALVPRERPCYLALDFFWLHAQPGRDALDTVTALRGRLRLVGTVENDLNVVTLADFLTPSELATKLSGRPAERSSPVQLADLPAPLDGNADDRIAIFAITPE